MYLMPLYLNFNDPFKLQLFGELTLFLLTALYSVSLKNVIIEMKDYKNKINEKTIEEKR